VFGVLLALTARAGATDDGLPGGSGPVEADRTLSANRGLEPAGALDDSALAPDDAAAGAALALDDDGALALALALDGDDGALAGADPARLELEAAELRRALGGGRADGFADAGELYDVGLRHQRPSRWGRLDLALTWRRALDDAAAGASRRDELWLLAIWSR